jgi:hypothetical protein
MLSGFGIDIGMLDDDAHPQIAVKDVFTARLYLTKLMLHFNSTVWTYSPVETRIVVDVHILNALQMPNRSRNRARQFVVVNSSLQLTSI